jgi:hypothetical protein
MLSISIPEQAQILAENQSLAAGFETVSDYMRYLIIREQTRLESSEADCLKDYNLLAQAGLEAVYADEPDGLWESCLEA